MASHGRSTSPGWKIGLPTCIAGFIVEHTRHSHRGEYTLRKKTDGDVRWGSRHWRTKLSNRLWSPSSTRFTRKTFSASRMVFVRGAAAPSAGCAVLCAHEKEGELRS